MREILVGLAVAAVLVMGFAVLYGGAGNKLSARDQALLTEFKQFREFLNDSPIQPAMPDHLIKIFTDGTPSAKILRSYGSARWFPDGSVNPTNRRPI